MTPRAHRRKLAAAALAVACVIIYLWMLFAWETAWGVDLAWREDAPFARHGKYLFDRRKNGNPNVVSGGLSLVVCAAAAFVGAVIALAVTACIRRRRRRSYRSASDVELKDVDAGAAAELVFATCGARPDLGDILRRANEELGADADVLIGGPQRLIDGLEDRLKGRVVERMTWAM